MMRWIHKDWEDHLSFSYWQKRAQDQKKMEMYVHWMGRYFLLPESIEIQLIRFLVETPLSKKEWYFRKVHAQRFCVCLFEIQKCPRHRSFRFINNLVFLHWIIRLSYHKKMHAVICAVCGEYYYSSCLLEIPNRFQCQCIQEEFMFLY